MATESPKIATELSSEHGRTIIADAVVAKVAGIAAEEIEGVAEIMPQGMGGAISGIAQRMTGSEKRGHGVNVEVGEHEAAIDLKLSVLYGYSIPQVSESVRQNIIEKVRSVTGLNVKEVNILVHDLIFREEEERPRAEEPMELERQRRVA